MSTESPEQPELSQPDNEPTFRMQLRFKKTNVLDLVLTPRDCFFELRSYISDLPDLYFQPSFHFQIEGRKVNEYNELQKEVPNLEGDQVLQVDIVLDDYEYHSARELVIRINEFFRSPKQLISRLRRSFTLTAVDSKANFIKLDFTNLLGKSSTGQKDKKDKKVNGLLQENLRH